MIPSYFQVGGPSTPRSLPGGRSAVALALAGALLLASAWPATAGTREASASCAASAPEASQAAFYRFQVGGVTVVALSDGTVPQDLHALLRDAHKDDIDHLLHRAFLSNPIEASINAYLIESGSRLALVDAGAGAFFGPGAGGKLVASLCAAGYHPDQVDDILLTHVHTDHSGGLVDGNGRPVFRRATVHVGQADLDFFLDPAHRAGVGGYDKIYFEQAHVSLQPYRAAGKLKGFAGTTQVIPAVRAVPTPGHTPGHAFFVLESEGAAIEFIGDVLHVQAVQMARPEVTIVYDVEPPAARSQREQQFDRLARQRRMVAGAHLPFPGIGHLRRESAGFSFVPTDYRYRDGKP